MFNVESLKDYIDKISEEELRQLATKIYNLTKFIGNDYLKYQEWFFNKQLPETLNNSKRNILFVQDNSKIIAVSCLKKDSQEKKICTLYVTPSYRRKGIGSILLIKAMEWLETTKPYITIRDYKLKMFKPFLQKYNWELTEIIQVNSKEKEFCYNGVLKK